MPQRWKVASWAGTWIETDSARKAYKRAYRIARERRRCGLPARSRITLLYAGSNRPQDIKHFEYLIYAPPARQG